MDTRALDQIEDDLINCSQYAAIGTTQAAIKFCKDLQINLLHLCAHVRALEEEVFSHVDRRDGGE